MLAEVVKNVLVDEFILAHTLDHAVALLPESADDAKDRDARSDCIVGLCAYLVRVDALTGPLVFTKNV